MEYQRRNGYVLVLRTCAADMTSRHDFVWPKKGYVKAPDWNPKPFCGKGLHGLLWGEGDGRLLSWEDDAKWLVCEVRESQIVDLGGKVKFPRAKVIYCGDRKTATDLIYRVRPGEVVGATIERDQGVVIAGFHGSAVAGDNSIAKAGLYGTATVADHGVALADDEGTAIAGYCGVSIVNSEGTAIAGHYGIATVGGGGTAKAGDDGTAIVGDRGIATVTYGGTAIAGDGGKATVGYFGKATAGCRGVATAGDLGIAIADVGGIAMAGIHGIIQISCFFKGRKRIVVGYIGEDGLLPDTPYKLNERTRKFVKTKVPAP